MNEICSDQFRVFSHEPVSKMSRLVGPTFSCLYDVSILPTCGLTFHRQDLGKWASSLLYECDIVKLLKLGNR